MLYNIDKIVNNCNCLCEVSNVEILVYIS